MTDIQHQPPLTVREKIAGALALLSPIAGILLVGLAVSGCVTKETGICVRSNASSAIELCDIKWDEYKIPVVSIVSGPRTTVYVHKDYTDLRKVSVTGAITNSVSALGVLESNEEKSDTVVLEFNEK